MVNLKLIAWGALMAALAVGIGAFGAHGLAEMLAENERTDTFETAVKYHFYHALGLMILGIMAKEERFRLVVSKAGYLLLLGIFIFSGSLYVLCLTEITRLGMITPIGGLCFIGAWVWIAIVAFQGES